MTSPIDESLSVNDPLPVDEPEYEEEIPEVESPPPGTILTEHEMLSMSHADLEKVQKILAGGSRHYLCEKNFELQQELEADIGYFSRMEAFIDANGNRCSVHANGPLALMLSGIDARIYDLPALEAECSTAFVIPTGKMFISANFFKQIKKCPEPEIALNFLLRHEMNHLFREHFNRFKNTPYTQQHLNIAEDYIINVEQLKAMAVDGALVSMSSSPPAVFDIINDSLHRSRYEQTLKKTRNALLQSPLRNGCAIEEADFKEFESFQTEEEVAEYLYTKQNIPDSVGDTTPKQRLVAVMKGLSQDVIAMGGYANTHPLLRQNAPIIAGYVDTLAQAIEANQTVKRKDILAAMGGLIPLQGSDELVERNLEHNLSVGVNGSKKPGVVNTGIPAIDELPPSKRLAETLTFLNSAYQLAPSNGPSSKQDDKDSIRIESDQTQQSDSAGPSQNSEASGDANKSKNEIHNLDEAEAKMNQSADNTQNAAQDQKQHGQDQEQGQDNDADSAVSDSNNQQGNAQQGNNKQGGSQQGQNQAGQKSDLNDASSGAQKTSGKNHQDGSEQSSGSEQDLEDQINPTQAIHQNVGLNNSNERHVLSEAEFNLIVENDTSLAKDRAEIIKKGLGMDDTSTAARDNRLANVKHRIALDIDQARAEASKSKFAQPGAHQVDASYSAIASFNRPVIELKTVFKKLLTSQTSNTIRQNINKQHPIDYSRQQALIMAGKQDRPYFTPGIRRTEEKKQVVAVLVDSSGSVDDAMLNDFISNSVGISKLNKNIEVVVVIGDTIGRGQAYVLTQKTVNSLKEMVAGGRGGTDLTAMIQDTCSMFSVKENGPFNNKELAAIVYFTDGGDAAPSPSDLKLAAAKHLKSGKMPPLIWAIPQQAASSGWTTEFIKKASVYSAVYVYNAAQLRSANEQMKIDIRSVPDTAARLAALTRGNESAKPKRPKP